MVLGSKGSRLSELLEGLLIPSMPWNTFSPLLFYLFPSLQAPLVTVPFTRPQRGVFLGKDWSTLVCLEELLISAFWFWPRPLSALCAALWDVHLGSAAGERQGWCFLTEQRTLGAPQDPLSLPARTAPLPESRIHRRPQKASVTGEPGATRRPQLLLQVDCLQAWDTPSKAWQVYPSTSHPQEPPSPKSTYTPSDALAFLPNGREKQSSPRSPLPAGPGGDDEQAAAAIPGLPLSQTLRFSPPAPVCGLSPPGPAPRDGICAWEFPTQPLPSAVKGLRHPTLTSSPRTTVWERPKRGKQAIPVEEEAPCPAWKSRHAGKRPEGRAGAARGPPPLSRGAPRARPRAPLDEGAVCAQAQARAASGAGSAPGAPGGLCRAGPSAACQNFSPDTPSRGGPAGPAVLQGRHCPLPSLTGSHVLRVSGAARGLPQRLSNRASGQEGNSSHGRSLRNERVPARPQIPNERRQAGLFSAEKHEFVKNKPLCGSSRMKLHAI